MNRRAIRAAVAAIDIEGFVPFMAWRDPEARIAALEHAFTVRMAVGQRLLPPFAAWRRLPAWAR